MLPWNGCPKTRPLPKEGQSIQGPGLWGGGLNSTGAVTLRPQPCIWGPPSPRLPGIWVKLLFSSLRLSSRHLDREPGWHRSGLYPRGALSENVTGIAICLSNRAGSGGREGLPHSRSDALGWLLTFPHSCWADAAARSARLGSLLDPTCLSLQEESPVARESWGKPEQRGGQRQQGGGAQASDLPGRPAPGFWTLQHPWDLGSCGPSRACSLAQANRYFRPGCAETEEKRDIF